MKNIPIKSVLNKHIAIIFLIFLFVSMGVHFVNNSSSGVLGKDESLYIFLGKGHSDNTPIDAPIGSWLDAMKKGVQRTSDPPGIFLLLHLWEKISFSENWLRLLPYIFFAISVITVIKTGFLIKLPPFFSICLGFLPLASQRMVLHALEIRAYGMEICLTYLMIYFALKLLININEGVSSARSDWTIFSLVMIAGLSSRFSFVISSAAMYGVMWLSIMLRMKFHYFKSNLISVAISSIVSFLVFSIFLGISQYLAPNNSLNTVSPDYDMFARPATFMGVFLYFAKQILLIPLALFGGSDIRGTPCMYIVIILLLGIAYICLISAYNFIKNNGITKIKKDLILYFGVFLFPLLALLMSVALAVAGLHPFSITSRVSIYLQTSFHLFIMGLALLFTSRTGNNVEKGHVVLNKLYRVSFTFIVAVLVLIYGSLYLYYNTTFRMGGRQETIRVISNAIRDNELKNIDYWYISLGESNSFKYHVLYGGLKDKLSPKARIVIENRSAGEVLCGELKKIYNEAEDKNKIVMVLGHVSKKEAEVYVEIFEKYFPNAKLGVYETTSSEQVLFAIR